MDGWMDKNTCQNLIIKNGTILPCGKFRPKMDIISLYLVNVFSVWTLENQKGKLKYESQCQLLEQPVMAVDLLATKMGL